MTIKNFLKKYGNFIFLFVLIVLTIVVIATQVDLKEFIDTLSKANLFFIGIGILCVVIFWLFEAFIFLHLFRRSRSDEKFSFAMVITLVGQYYNLVTPGASGGQPLQLLEMTRKNYPVGIGTAVLVQKYALYQIAVVFTALVSIIINWNTLATSSPAAQWLVGIGFLVNSLGVILVIILSLSENVARIIVFSIVKFLCAIRLFKDKEKLMAKAEKYISDYSIAIEDIKNHKKETVILMLVSIVQILIYFSINYWVYRSLGLKAASPFFIITMQAVLYIAMTFVPLPGGSGGAEVGFALLFGPIYGKVNASVGLVLWRFITFFFIILFCGIFLAVREFYLGRKKLSEASEDQI